MNATNTADRKSSPTARGMVYLIMARGCFMVSGYVISLILARGLGPAQYGVYGVIMSVLVWVEMLGAAGLPGATATLIAQDESRTARIEQTARALLLAWALVLTAACWLLAPSLARILDLPDSAWLFRVAFLDLPFNGLYVAYQGTFNGVRRFSTLSIAFVAYSLTKLVGTLALLAIGLSVSGALIVNVIATLGGIVYFVGKMPPRNWAPDRTLVPLMLRIGGVMGAYVVILQILLSIDLWMLQSQTPSGEDTIGLYVAALNVARLPLIVPSVLSSLLFASMSWARARGDRALAQRYLQAASRFVLVLLLPSCALAALHADSIMGLLYSKVYEAGGVYLSVQVAAFGLVALLDAHFHALMAFEKRRQAVCILASLVPVAVVLNLLLIPRWGALGAAMALTFTMVGGAVVGLIATAREFGALVKPLTLVRVVGASSVTVLLGTQSAVLELPVFWDLCLLMGVYVGFLWLSKEIGPQDLHPFAFWRRTDA